MKIYQIAAAGLLALTMNFGAFAQATIPLYKTIPNSKPNDVKEVWDSVKVKRIRVSKVATPTLTVYLPDKSVANGTAIVICPGGGYSYLVINNEGHDVAKAFAEKGVAAFVLKYRLPNDVTMKDRSIGPLQDAQQAIKIVRDRAKEWHIDTAKVGIIGFSAGGHLASTASTHFNMPVIDNPSKTSLRPSFSILVYPVISFTDSLVHKGSKKALIGEDAPQDKVILYSNELQVNANTPPAFLVHCTDDKVVPVANSIDYYLALHKHGVKAEMHIYQSGGHGFGMNNKTTSDKWMEHCFNWMRVNKLL